MCILKLRKKDIFKRKYEHEILILKHVEISSLFDKKWSISYYIIDEKVYPIEKERENDYIIFKYPNYLSLKSSFYFKK